jgi:hypothetical protein
MIKLKELVKNILKELDLTPTDLKKFNKIMRNKTRVKNSIHADDEPNYGKEGFGYGGPPSPIYQDKAPDRSYVSRKKSVGSTKIVLTPEV